MVRTDRPSNIRRDPTTYIAEIALKREGGSNRINYLRVYHHFQSIYFVFSTSATCLPTLSIDTSIRISP
jgi:hypothetical protein